MAGTIICYGDSNTYGYDPRSFLGGRYPKEARWPEIIGAQTGWNVYNYGQNGRCTPYFLPEIDYVRSRLEQWKNEQAPVWLWVMLGTNDLLHNAMMTAQSAAERMERFLRKIMNREEIAGGHISILLISPVHLKRGAWVESDRLCRESEKLDEYYRIIAEKLGIEYMCAGEWGVELLFDGVHFSEEGNRRFAECAMIQRGLR